MRKLSYKQLRYVAAGSVSFAVGIFAFVIFWSFTKWATEYVLFTSLIFCVIAGVVMFGITYDEKEPKRRMRKKARKAYKVPIYTFSEEQKNGFSDRSKDGYESGSRTMY